MNQIDRERRESVAGQPIFWEVSQFPRNKSKKYTQYDVRTRQGGKIIDIWHVRDSWTTKGTFASGYTYTHKWSCSCGERDCVHIINAKAEMRARQLAKKRANKLPVVNDDLCAGLEKSFAADW